MNLAADAQNARDVGTAFDRFLDALPDHFTEITALVAELYAIGSVLRDLDLIIISPEYGRRAICIQDDLDLVQLSISITLRDVRELCGGLDRDGYPPTARAYREVWTDLCRHFERESGNTLQTRLERFRQFIMELCCTMQRLGPKLLSDASRLIVVRHPPDPREMERLRWSINALVDAQTRRLDAVALGPQLGRRRSFPRLRGGAEPRSPPSPFFPRAPEVPISPTIFSNSSHSSGSNSVISHWAVTVFEQAQSATPFRASGQVSACLGPDMPDARSRLAQEYERICELPFDNQDMIVYLYLRHPDLRARILCRSMRSNRPKLCCLPLSVLKANRSQSCIQLRKPSLSGRPFDVWANLRFTTYERMILFYCSFLALRSQDLGSPVRDIDDHELHGEEELFAGKIYDDGYMHALRLYQDQDSKGIRIQASALSGELKRTPIWTAFITHHIASPTWMRRRSRVIHLRELNRFIFSPDYEPQYGPRGEHELQFTAEDDAVDFENIIEDLAADL